MGELYATREIGRVPFDEYTAELSEVVVGLIVAGVSKARAWQHLLATTDPMTGLADRGVFDERVHKHFHGTSSRTSRVTR